jgi:hypothetical protein
MELVDGTRQDDGRPNCEPPRRLSLLSAFRPRPTPVRENQGMTMRLVERCVSDRVLVWESPLRRMTAEKRYQSEPLRVINSPISKRKLLTAETAAPFSRPA